MTSIPIPIGSFKPGRLPHDPRPARLVLAGLVTAAPAPPASADWLSAVTSWPMLGNDVAGDCTAAGAGHVAQQVNRYGRDQDAPVTTDDAITMYSSISGYRPGDSSTDIGATLQQALDYWRKTGIGGNKIAAFAQVDVTDLAMVRQCIATFGAVYCGMWMPQSAMDQLNAGKPWAVAKRSKNLGGHCINIGAYDPATFWCVTWGRRQAMSVDFFRAQIDECWVPIDLDWLRGNGLSPAGLNTTDLNAGFLALTGQPGPFPATPAPPVPAPPVPAPPVPAPITPSDVKRAAADVVLSRAFADWQATR